MPAADLRTVFDPREVIARVVDGSRFDEFKPLYGPSLVTGWASIHGYPVGILANHRGILFCEEADKATQFIQLANQVDTPLLFLQNTTGYMVGKDYEQRGIIKDGAKMINAVSNSQVPHLTVNIGASYGAGQLRHVRSRVQPALSVQLAQRALGGHGPGPARRRALDRRRAKAAESRGEDFDEEADAAMREAVESQIDRESMPLFLTGLLYDDGIIDPRDTRTVLGLCLSVIDSNEIHGTRGYGVFRM